MENRIEDDLSFIDTSVALKLLEPTDADSLRSSIHDNDTHVSQRVLERGLMSPADVDIVRSIQNPTSVVPGYEILEMVGRGGMGVVYKARQLDLDRVVALKTIRLDANDATAIARFQREAKSLAQLQHPNIIQALNFGQHHGRHFFAMEFVQGRTCEQAVHLQCMRPDDVWPIVRQVASGLLHALKNNLIHRDIKPANLILVAPPEGAASDAEVVKIADFGLAMFAEQESGEMKLTTGGKVLGSPAYMSLQQLGGEQVDFRTDIYSLGASAWHLLFGATPFDGSSIASLYRQKSQRLSIDPLKLPVSLPADQLQLLTSMLDPELSLRPESYEALIDSIDRLSVMDSAAPRGVASPAAANPIDMAVTQAVAAPLPMSETVETPAQGSQQHPIRSHRGWLAAAIALIAGLAITFSMMGSTRGPRVYTRVIETVPLFDGETLSGWDVSGAMVGAWNTVPAPDLSNAIACTEAQGVLGRTLPEFEHPKFSLFVWLLPECDMVDIDFAFDSLDETDLRGSLRLSATSSRLGKKSSDFSDFKSIAEIAAPGSIHERFHVVDIERQPEDWFVFVEEKFVGSLPIDEVGSGQQLRLVVHGSKQPSEGTATAFFADVQLHDLGLPASPKSTEPR
ncbi:MAG: serine/threonine-protein kinase [Rubripirellula sp.]